MGDESAGKQNPEKYLEVIDSVTDEIKWLPLAGSQAWHGLVEYGNWDPLEDNFSDLTEESLYRLTTGEFFVVRHVRYLMVDVPPGIPTAIEVSNEDAIKWFLKKGDAEIPEDLGGMEDKFLLRPKAKLPEKKFPCPESWSDKIPVRAYVTGKRLDNGTEGQIFLKAAEPILAQIAKDDDCGWGGYWIEELVEIYRLPNGRFVKVSNERKFERGYLDSTTEIGYAVISANEVLKQFQRFDFQPPECVLNSVEWDENSCLESGETADSETRPVKENSPVEPSAEELDEKIEKMLIENPRTTSEVIGNAIGKSASWVRRRNPWKVVQAELERRSSPGMLSLGDGASSLASSDLDPARLAEDRETLERLVREQQADERCTVIKPRMRT